ncbi:MAG: TnpV protein [Oscillospiraceae bacterium]|nr:TnpV protein [Oscillospiraceae bacterium]
MTEALTYTTRGDYQYPDLTLPEPEVKPLGKYGLMHKKYLKQSKPATYNRLLLSGTLTAHLAEIDATATEMVSSLTAQMAQTEGVTESLKAENQMLWVQMMNNIRQRAEEIATRQLILT